MDKKTSIFGLILVVIGFLLLLSRFEVHLFQFLLPLGLMILGIWLIWKKRQRANAEIPPPPGSTYTYNNTAGGTIPGSGEAASPHTPPYGAPPPPPPPPGVGYGPAALPHVEGSKIKYSKFLGDMFIECSNISLQNVEVSMFAGDLQINLRGGKLAPGLNRMIVSGFIGDVMIFVPQGFAVFIHCSGFVGDLDVLGRRSSGFGNTLDAQTAEYDGADSKLYIAVNNFIGDVRVYGV